MGGGAAAAPVPAPPQDRGSASSSMQDPKEKGPAIYSEVTKNTQWSHRGEHSFDIEVDTSTMAQDELFAHTLAWAEAQRILREEAVQFPLEQLRKDYWNYTADFLQEVAMVYLEHQHDDLESFPKHMDE